MRERCQLHSPEGLLKGYQGYHGDQGYSEGLSEGYSKGLLEG